MGYKIQGSGPRVTEGTALFAGTAREALCKLEAMKHRCHPDGRVRVFANGIGISEEELDQLARNE